MRSEWGSVGTLPFPSKGKNSILWGITRTILGIGCVAWQDVIMTSQSNKIHHPLFWVDTATTYDEDE